jgi:phospholipid N-methyltransferase
MIQFLSIAFRNMKTVGTICPSSPMLSRELAESAITATSPKRVLEVGPGTGPVTKEILKSLRDGDVLDIVELSTEFCTDLEAKVIGPWKAKGRPGQVTLHNAAIQDVPLEAGSYDCVVCGLPFNNFEHELVETIMLRLLDLLRPGGELSYFCYLGAKAMKSTVLDGPGRDNLRAIARLEDELHLAHSGTRRVVLANFPPAEVRRLRKP